MPHHRPGAGVQIARARVVAEPGPGLEHVVERGCGQRLHVRPACDETAEVRRHGRHRGLLQHDFRQPNPVGIRGRTATGAPGQIATVKVIPVEQVGGGRLLVRFPAPGADFLDRERCVRLS